jgi:hypothetical protein
MGAGNQDTSPNAKHEENRALYSLHCGTAYKEGSHLQGFSCINMYVWYQVARIVGREAVFGILQVCPCFQASRPPGAIVLHFRAPLGFTSQITLEWELLNLCCS